MLTQLRTQMKLIMWIMVFAFLATIVFSWGMGGFKDKAEAGIIGKVDNMAITYEEFQEIIQRNVNLETRKTEEELDQDQIKKIREQSWDDYVETLLKDREAARLGLSVSSKEIAHVIENYPPPEIQQAELFQKDGQFDPQAYKEFLRTPRAREFLIGLEESVREHLLQQKLFHRVMQTTVVTEEEIKDKYIADNITGKLKFIPVLFKDIEVDSSEIAEEKMREYYRMFPGQFKQYPQRQFAYVKFDLKPSAQDSADVLRDAEELMDRISNGEDFGKLAKTWSQDEASAIDGGDLGWFSRGKMVEDFDNAAFNAEPGELLGPVESRSGYHIIELLESSGGDDPDSVHARHILLKIEPSAETRDEVYNIAYNFSQEVKEHDFLQTAEEMGLEVDTTREFSEAGYIAGLGRMRMAAEFCFNNEIGTVSEVYPYPQGYVVFQITNTVEEGVKPYEQVESSIRKKLEDILEKNKAWNAAGDLLAEINSPEDMESAAAQMGYQVYVTDDSVKVSSSMPGGLSTDKEFMTKAFRLEKGELSGIIEGKRGYYIAYMMDKSDFNQPEFEAEHEFIYQQLVQQEQNSAVRNWIRELRIAADIQDYRYKYFRDF